MNSEANADFKTASFIHLSTFSKYVIPLGNFLFPLIIWTTGKSNNFIDAHGRQALNFQISIFLYWVLLIFATASSLFLIGPFFITLGISGLLALALFILDLVAVISATLKAGKGEYYQYPFSIPFLKSPVLIE